MLSLPTKSQGHDPQGVGAVKRWLDRLGAINPKKTREIIAFCAESKKDEDNFCEVTITVGRDPADIGSPRRCLDLWVEYQDDGVT